MLIQITGFGILLYLTCLISIYLIYIFKGKKDNKIYYYLILLFIFFTIDLLAQALECSFTPFNFKSFFGHICVIGYSIAPVFWLLFVYAFTNKGKTMSRKLECCLLIIPIFVVFLVITDPWLHCYFSNITWSTSAYTIQLHYSYTWGNHIIVGYNIILALTTAFLLIKEIIKGNKLFRKSYCVLITATLIVFLMSILNVSNILPNFSFEALSIVISILLITTSVLMYDSLDLLNLLDMKIINELNRGVVFFNSQDILKIMNTKGHDFCLNTEDIINQKAENVFKFRPEMFNFYNNSELKTYKLTQDNKCFEITKDKIMDNGKFLGTTLIIKDITSDNYELNHKDMLIKDVNLRVKNNLQIILSLLNIDLHSHPDDSYVVIEDTRSRIRFMSSLHEEIYKSANFHYINVKDFLPKITKNIFSMHNTILNTQYNLEDYMVDIDLAMYLGLILIEVYSISIKYNLIENNDDIYMKFRICNDFGVLDLIDQNQKLEYEINIENSENLSYMIIKNLLNQIDGTLIKIPEENTHVRIKFPLKK